MSKPSLPNGFTLRDGVQSEHRRTVQGFDFDLPPGFTFPKESPLAESSPGTPTIYEQGFAAMGVYFWWEAAMISAAVTAHVSGREAEAHSYINDLIEGTKSELYRTYMIEQPGAGWVDRVARPVLERGDYSALFAQLMKAKALLGFTEVAKDAGHSIR